MQFGEIAIRQSIHTGSNSVEARANAAEFCNRMWSAVGGPQRWSLIRGPPLRTGRWSAVTAETPVVNTSLTGVAPYDGTDASWLRLVSFFIEIPSRKCCRWWKIARWKPGQGCGIAWRIVDLAPSNRTCPDLPCASVFAEHEWKPVWRVVTSKPLPQSTPSVNEFLKLLTHPGVTTTESATTTADTFRRSASSPRGNPRTG